MKKYFKLIDAKFEIELESLYYLGRGSNPLNGKYPGWSTSRHFVYRCASCGSTMSANNKNNWNCECNAMYLDIDACRFGSDLGSKNVLMYSKVKPTWLNRLYLKVY
jgi:hypothetical protein